MLPAGYLDHAYNAFKFPNMDSADLPLVHQEIVRFLQSIGQPARLEILQKIGSGEACFCHLETALGYRQPYISQHLMALREAGILTARRQGRYAFYSLRDVALLDLIDDIGSLVGIQGRDLAAEDPAAPLLGCVCPHCQEE